MPVGQFRRYPTASDLSKKGRILVIVLIYYHNSIDNSGLVWCGTSPNHLTAVSEDQKQQSVSPAPGLEDSVKAESVNPSVCNVMLSSYGPKGLTMRRSLHSGA
jgi:hypothetical protein